MSDPLRPHIACRAPLSMEFSSQEYWSGCHFLFRDLPEPGIKPMSLASPALAGRFLTIVPPGKSFPSPTPYQNIAATKTSRATHFLLNFMLTLGKKQSSFFSLKFSIIFVWPGFFNTAQISHLLPCGLPGRSPLIICCEYMKGPWGWENLKMDLLLTEWTNSKI